MVDEVIIVVHQDWVKRTKKLYPLCKIVTGGKTRSASTFNGIKASMHESDNVLIHDAVRPFVDHCTISNCILSLKSADAVAPILEHKDSIIKVHKKKYGN